MQSVSQQIVKVLNETPNLKSSEIAKKMGVDVKKVYHSLYYMVRAKKLKRKAGRYSIVYELPMTTMPVVEVSEPTSAKPETSSNVRDVMVRRLMSQLNSLQKDYEYLKEEHKENLIKFYDAKAVIKYLEDKLVSVLGGK